MFSGPLRRAGDFPWSRVLREVAAQKHRLRRKVNIWSWKVLSVMRANALGIVLSCGPFSGPHVLHRGGNRMSVSSKHVWLEGRDTGSLTP